MLFCYFLYVEVAFGSKQIATQLVNRLNNADLCQPHQNLQYQFVSNDVESAVGVLKCYLSKSEKIAKFKTDLEYFILKNRIKYSEILEFKYGYTKSPMTTLCIIDLENEKVVEQISGDIPKITWAGKKNIKRRNKTGTEFLISRKKAFDNIKVTVYDVRLPSLGLTTIIFRYLLKVENLSDHSFEGVKFHYDAYINDKYLCNGVMASNIASIPEQSHLKYEADIIVSYFGLGSAFIESLKKDKPRLRLKGRFIADEFSKEIDISR